LKDDQKTLEDAGKLLKYLSDELIEEINCPARLVGRRIGRSECLERARVRSSASRGVAVKVPQKPEAEGRKVELCSVWDGTIQTDRRLLRRVLSNMLKNGLEATAPGQTVALNCTERGDSAVFTVHNREVMPADVQLQIFQRSFSTKGEAGRGIGTYSIKLLGQQYLGGKVEFTSREPEGTAFVLTVPKKM